MSAESLASVNGDGRHQAGLLLGSNINPAVNLCAAVEHLARLGRVEAVSRVWQSAPVGDENQPDFCNAAVLLSTAQSRDELRLALRDIEQQLGRVRDPHNKNAARTIDLDISIWRPADGLHHADVDPEVTQRAFAAACLAEILPQIPLGHQTLENVARQLQARDAARLRLIPRDDVQLTRIS